MRIPFVGKNVPTNMLKSAFSGSGVDGTRLTQSKADSFYDVTKADRPLGITVNGKEPVDFQKLRNQLGIDQPRIGVIGTLKTIREAAPRDDKSTKPDSKDDRDHCRRAA